MLVTLSKACRVCNRVEKAVEKGEVVTYPEHECSRNYTGSSKGMEAEGLICLYTNGYCQGYYEIDTLIIDGDSSIKANVKHGIGDISNQPGYTGKMPTACQIRDDKGMMPINILEIKKLAR